jgi:hypothetical protein
MQSHITEYMSITSTHLPSWVKTLVGKIFAIILTHLQSVVGRVAGADMMLERDAGTEGMGASVLEVWGASAREVWASAVVLTALSHVCPTRFSKNSLRAALVVTVLRFHFGNNTVHFLILLGISSISVSWSSTPTTVATSFIPI